MIFPTLSHVIPTTIFQGGYYYFPIPGVRSGGSERLSNIYRVTQPIRDSVGMGLTNFKCVLLTLKGTVQMGLLKDSLSGISCTVQSICVTPCDWYVLLGNMAVESLSALELGRLGLELELQRWRPVEWSRLVGTLVSIWPMFQAWPCHWPIIWPWASSLSSLTSLSHLWNRHNHSSKLVGLL